MALEYSLVSDIESIEEFCEIVSEKLNLEKVEINRTKKNIMIDVHKNFGFYITIINSNKKIRFLSDVFKSKTSAIFRIDKKEYNENSINIKFKLLFLILNIVSNKYNFIFTFNGENLLLLQKKGYNAVKVNKYYSIWDDIEFEKILNDEKYEIIKTNEEIKYYFN